MSYYYIAFSPRDSDTLETADGTTMKKGFTIVELVIVMAIISILAAVLIPSIVNGANNAKQDIIDIYNGQTVKMIDNDTGEILYEGKETSEIDGYSLVNVEVKDGVVIMYMSNELKKEG